MFGALPYVCFSKYELITNYLYHIFQINKLIVDVDNDFIIKNRLITDIDNVIININNPITDVDNDHNFNKRPITEIDNDLIFGNRLFTDIDNTHLFEDIGSLLFSFFSFKKYYTITTFIAFYFFIFLNK